MSEKKIQLTSSEIASLWLAYMDESMSKCMIGFMLQHIEDPDIKPVVQSTYDISSNRVNKLLTIFTEERYAVPNGFTDEDVNMNAPWLFTDLFCLTYVNHLARIGMLKYSGFVSMCSREDIRNWFTLGLTEMSTLYNQSTEIALSKGLSS